MRVEQEHKLTEDARLYAEQEAASQQHAVHLLQVLYVPLSLQTFMCLFHFQFMPILFVDR